MGSEGANPAVWRQTVRDQLVEFYGDTTKYKKGRIVSLRQIEVDGVNRGVFEAKDEEGGVVRARKVILATGVKDHLPQIPGVAEQWGHRIIHCVYCHGTETAKKPVAFLYDKPNAALNSMIVEKMLYFWPGLENDPRYVLTNGVDLDTEEGRKAAGLEKYYSVMVKKGFRFITSPITSVKENKSTSSLEINFASHPTIAVDAMLVMPERITPSEHAASFLTEDLLKAPLGPMGSIPPPPPGQQGSGSFLVRMGDDPKTTVKGLFWAGNSGSPMANVTFSNAQGQVAAVTAADELGQEDLLDSQQ
ncbi:hypothetical protein CI109_102414 [Kwoniella shandongensis]|uniref:FAD/NAD(P)-binding domain-containing protein n=1 Tax=Kwoniella shandongensis TaxID=1734106 RepID=A0AAJ8LIY7_9TREE